MAGVMARTFRKRPETVEAVRWWGPFVADGYKRGPTIAELIRWDCVVEPTDLWNRRGEESGCESNADVWVWIRSGNRGLGRMLCRSGDWIIKSPNGECRSMGDDAFMREYETADNMPVEAEGGGCCDA